MNTNTAKLEVLDDDIPELQPEEQRFQVEKESQTYPMKAKEFALAIKDDEGYRNAADFLMTIKGFRKKVEDTFGPVVKKAYDAWKATVDLRKKADAPLDEAERIIKPAMAVYLTEKERAHRQEEERLRAEQKKKDDEARMALAAEVHKSGEIEVANAILEQAPAPIVLPRTEAPKVQGISAKDVWKCEVFDINALIKAVADGIVPKAVLQVNESELNRLAKALKAEMRYPGTRVWCEKDISSRAKVA